jgi:hypothetical protein
VNLGSLGELMLKLCFSRRRCGSPFLVEDRGDIH